MQEQHFEELKSSLTDDIAAAIPRENLVGVKEKVAKAIDRMNDENKLMSLPPDEFRLLLDYRLWKESPSAVAGVFHWRKRTS